MDTGGRTADRIGPHSSAIAPLLREKDWTNTPLGPMKDWPQSLRTALSICLGSPQPSVIYWGESHTVLYNDAFLPLIGPMHPDALGMAGQDVWPESWREIEPRLTAARDQNITTTSEQHVNVERDGRFQDVLFTCSYTPIHGESGISGILATATESPSREPDASRPPASRADASETLFAAIFDAIADAAFVYDRNGTIVRMNSAARELYQLDTWPGYETLSPQERTSIIAAQDERGEDIPAELSGLYRLLAGEVLTGANAMDVRLHLAGGRELQVNITGSPLHDASGAITGAVAIARDVTQRRQLEREVVERASLLEAVFAATSDQIVIYDHAGTIVQLNPPAEEIAGPARDQARLPELVRLFDMRTVDGAAFPKEELPVARALQGETVSGVEMVLRQANEADQTILASASPYYGDGGVVRGAVSVVHDITALRQAEQQARWQASMLERAHDAIFMWELGGHIIYWNRGAEMLYGFTKEEAVGKVSHDLLQTRLPLPRSRFEAVLARAGEWTGEVTHTTRDGRPVVVLSRQQLLTEPDGHRFVLETSRDITERKTLERAIRDREERLDAILQLLPVGVAFADARGRIELVNQALMAIRGDGVPLVTDTEDAAQHTAWRTETETGQPLAPDEWGLRHALATGEVSLDNEVEIESLDGRRKTVMNSTAPMRDESGSIIGAVSVTVDITERKRLERRTNEALNALLTMAEELVRLPDAAVESQAGESRRPSDQDAVRGVIRRLLTLTQSILGCQRAGVHVIRRGSDRFVPLDIVGLALDLEHMWHTEPPEGIDLRSGLPAEMWEELLAGEIVFVDYRKPPFLGRPNPYDIHVVLVAPMRIGQELVGMLTLDYGVEDHTYTGEEMAFAAASAQLATLAVERERLLHEREEARAAVLALEETNRRMSDFLGTASHELRTPLTSIQANVQIIDRQLARLTSSLAAQSGETTSPESIRAYLAPISLLTERTERQMFRLNRLIGDLLDATRIRAGKLEYHPEPCDLVTITREAVQEQRAAWPGRRITLEADPWEIPVVCDGDRIGQVVTNYLTNALKYSLPDRAVAVRLHAEGNTARVEVRDRGPGLSSEQQSGLFQRFYRAPGIVQVSGSGIGLGLGLFICRTIIERHDGTVGVESVPEEGSTFWFTIPTARPA